LSPNADAVTREFFDFYRTPRGQYIPSNIWIIISEVKLGQMI
jgi:hypothetical protein